MSAFGRSPVLPLAAFALVGAGACGISVDHQAYIERDQKRFPATGVVDLHLTTFDGSIEIRSWDRPEVVVDIEKRGRDKNAVAEIEVVAERTGDRIQIEARHPHATGVFVLGFAVSSSARLIANVPRRVNLVVNSGDGSIAAEQVEGRLELRTGDGSIRATGIGGEVLADTGDGSIQLDDVTGRVEARTGDGSVRISGVPGALRARTGDGSVVLRIRRGAAMTDDWTVTTGDGSISAELPDGFDAEIEADPGSDGHARSDLTLTNVTGGTSRERVLRGRLGSGGHKFTLRTGDGTIRLTNY